MFDYDTIEAEEMPAAQRLALWWAHRHPGKTFLDIGAGTGCYTQALLEQGIQAQGIDLAEPSYRPGVVTSGDLFTVEQGADITICLEVAEHLEPEQSVPLVEKLYNLTGSWCYFSAAQPGQGGVGHTNCNTPEYWQTLAINQGFIPDQPITNLLKAYAKSGYHMGWFVNNIQAWRKQ